MQDSRRLCIPRKLLTRRGAAGREAFLVHRIPAWQIIACQPKLSAHEGESMCTQIGSQGQRRQSCWQRLCCTESKIHVSLLPLHHMLLFLKLMRAASNCILAMHIRILSIHHLCRMKKLKDSGSSTFAMSTFKGFGLESSPCC